MHLNSCIWNTRSKNKRLMQSVSQQHALSLLALNNSRLCEYQMFISSQVTAVRYILWMFRFPSETLKHKRIQVKEKLLDLAKTYHRSKKKKKITMTFLQLQRRQIWVEMKEKVSNTHSYRCYTNTHNLFIPLCNLWMLNMLCITYRIQHSVRCKIWNIWKHNIKLQTTH